jgi:hypothetical protein
VSSEADALLVAADVAADVASMTPFMICAGLGVALLDRDGVGLGAEAGDEARLVGRERGEVPRRDGRR